MSFELSGSAGGNYKREYFRDSCVFAVWGFFYFKAPIRGVVPGEGPLSGWAFIQLQVASLRMCCQEWREVETSSPRQFPHISGNLLSVGLWLRASGGERRDRVRKHCREIAKESLWSLCFPNPYNQDLTAALIVIINCCYLASDSGCQTIISCPG